MRCKIKGGFIGGQLFIPPSKSETMRAIIFASMAKGVSHIENILQSPDTYALIEGVRAFGVKVKDLGSSLEIEGVNGELIKPNKVIDVGNSGLALRFLLAFASLVDGEVLITGDESIRTRRPIKPLVDIFRKAKMSVVSFDESKNGIMSIKGKLKPGSMAMEGKDSQPVSAILFATSFLKGPSEIFVFNAGEKPWVDLTLHWLDFVGAHVLNHSYRWYEVEGGLSYQGFNLKVGGDYSTALFLVAAAMISKKSLAIYGLDPKSMQGDKVGLDIFRQMGAILHFLEDGALAVYPIEEIKGVEVNINNCIDILPILAVVATFATTISIITGAEIAKYKESNRIAVMEEQLKRMGAKVESLEDGMRIYPSKLKGAVLSGEKDHRVILALMVAAMSGNIGEVEIDCIESSVKTYPTAVYDFIRCGANIDLIKG
jgi:3-phosphoshikimate 1-carboxyvinyltransferase